MFYIILLKNIFPNYFLQFFQTVKIKIQVIFIKFNNQPQQVKMVSLKHSLANKVRITLTITIILGKRLDLIMYCKQLNLKSLEIQERRFGNFYTHRAYSGTGKQKVTYLVSLCKQMAEHGVGGIAKKNKTNIAQNRKL